MKRLGFAVVTLLLQLAVCEDYFWLHNSNWDEPNNWSLGRVPCGGQNVSFAAVSCDTPYVLVGKSPWSSPPKFDFYTSKG